MKKYLQAVFIFTLIFGLTLPLRAQILSHEVGRLWDTAFITGSIPNYAPIANQMTFPGGDFFFQHPKNLEGQGVWIGVQNWTDIQNVFHTNYVSEVGPLTYEALEYAAPISNKKYVRNRLPLVEVNKVRESRLLDSRTGSTRQTTLPSDEKIITIWATNVGVTVTKTSYAFANRKHDSYHIVEFSFQNTGNTNADAKSIELPGQNLTGVYLGFFSAFIPSGDWGHVQAGEELDDWVHYYGNDAGDSLRGLWYCYDGDNQRKTYDDIGDPSETTGEFLSPQHLGLGILHADAAYNDHTDDLNQPATVNWWPERRWRSHTKGDADMVLYGELSSGKKSYGTDVSETRNAWDPEVQHPIVYFSFGPYDIPFGEKINIVLYRAGGMISRKLAIDYGRKWKLGELQYNGLSQDAAKNAILATGKDSLFQAASRAQWVWKNGLATVPDGPPPPGLQIMPGPGKVDLTWDDVSAEPDPDTGVPDFAGYRIFRAVNHYTEEYSQIWECGGNSENPVVNNYTDYNVQRGKSYYYYVVAYDQNGHESSHFYNRNYQFGASPFLGAREQMDSVYVVPNPFHAQGLAFGGTIQEDYAAIPRIEDRMYFVGLPYRAIIRIFTVHGDLVTTLNHPDPTEPLSIENSADRAWYQISISWQTIKSGVYFYVVEGWNREGTYLGTTKGKFVVIR